MYLRQVASLKVSLQVAILLPYVEERESIQATCHFPEPAAGEVQPSPARTKFPSTQTAPATRRLWGNVLL